MKVLPFPDDTIAKFGFTHKVTLDHLDLIDTAGLVKTLLVFPSGPGELPGGTVIKDVALVVEVPFAGGVVASLTAAFGDEDVPDRYLLDADNNLMIADGGLWSLAATYPFMVPDPTNLRLRITSTVGNLSVLTAGRLALYFTALDLNELKKVS